MTISPSNRRISPSFFDEKKRIFGINANTIGTIGKAILDECPCVRLPYLSNTDLMDEWLEENTDGKWIWSSPFQMNYTDYWFLSEEDAIMFKLKWATPLDTNT